MKTLSNQTNMASSDLNGVKDGMQRDRTPIIPSTDSVSSLKYQGRMAKPSQTLIHMNNSSHSPGRPSPLDLFMPLNLSSLGGPVRPVTSSCASTNKAFPTGSSDESWGYQGARPKTFRLDARLTDSKRNAKATTGGEGARYRQGSVCEASSSRQRHPNQRYLSVERGAQDMKTGSSQKENVRKEVGNIPRNMLWMVDLSGLSGLEIVAKLANSHSGFQNVVKDTDRLRKRPDLLVLIVKLLAKVCDSEFRENKSFVLAQACHPEFLDQLADFMSNLLLHGHKNAFDVDGFLLNLLTFSKEVMVLLPNTTSERFRKILLFIDTAIRGFELYQEKSIRDDVKELHHSLQLQLKETIAETDERKVKVSSRSELLSLQTPPNDFYDISLIPTSEDIFSEEQAFVRPNLVHGAYTSVEHYLDVQFRLLHEDFLCPMREGIVEYVKKVESQKLQKGKPITSVRLYRKVMFLYPRVVADRIGIVVNFDPEKRLKNMQWRHSKRFMYGSLLCFTQDNFRNIMFATVVEREEKELQQGLIVVELCMGSQVREDLFRTEYTMAESEVYFEPYFQVLKALKDMTERRFPMRRYIVEAQREGGPPAYLMTDPPVQYTMEPGVSFPVLALDLWPSADELGLDDSQYKAFRFALTKEFVVIQGPPGTGKTYLGLKVAGILLENHKVWHVHRQPILVVCYTNHALDQFLEGILQYTTRIVRVGGQSKCEKLQSYSLKEVRRNYMKKMCRTADDVDEDDILPHMKNTNNLRRDIHARVKELMGNIRMIQMDLELLERNDGIISLKALYSVNAINSRYYGSFRGEDKEEVFVEWLLSQKEYSDPNFVIHVRRDHNVASEESNIVDEEIDAMEEVADRVTRNVHEGYLDMADIQGRLAYAHSLKALMEKQRELQKERTALIEEGRNNSEVLHLNMWFCEGRLSDAVHKLERLKQRLKEKRTPNQTEIQELLQQEDIWKLNFNDRWTLYS